MRLFPTEEWLEEYGRLLDDSDTLDSVAAGWGVNFNGDVLLVIEDLPLETTLGELPDEILEDVPEVLRNELLDLELAEAPSVIGEEWRAGLPESTRNLLGQLENNVRDGAIHAYIGLDEGTCTDVDVLDADETRDVGFVVRGDYGTWRKIVDGRPAASAILSGDLAVEGNAARLVQYFAVLQLLGDIAADVETKHVFQPPSASPADFVLDNAVRQPIVLQRFVHQQATWASKTLDIL